MEIDYQYIPSTMLHFEVHLTDHCNLNCVSCSHYSPLAKERYLDVNKYENDCKRLSELYGEEVGWLNLLGGEPLMHPKISKILEISRKAFKQGSIRIITNGILLEKMDETFWEVCVENNIEIGLSTYPVKLNYQRLKKMIEDHGVCNLERSGKSDVDDFRMSRGMLNLKKYGSADKNFYNCKDANSCWNLVDGKLYTCPRVAYADILKEYYDLDELYLSPRNGIDIYKAQSAREISEFLSRPVPFCKYCLPWEHGHFTEKWKRSSKDYYEYINFEGTERDFAYLESFNNIYVYGAGHDGRVLANRIQRKRDIKNFIVTNVDKKEVIDGITIVAYEEFVKSVDKENSIVLIAIYGSDKKMIYEKLVNENIRAIPIMKVIE